MQTTTKWTQNLSETPLTGPRVVPKNVLLKQEFNLTRILYRRSSATWCHRRHFMYLFDIWYFWPTTEALLVCQKGESWVTWPVSTWTSLESHVALARSQPISIQKLVPPGTRLLLIGCPTSSRRGQFWQFLLFSCFLDKNDNEVGDFGL